MSRDAEGIFRPEDRGVRALIESAYEKIPPALPAMKGKFGGPKPYALSFILSKMGIGGFYFPFTGEASYNRDLPGISRPFVMAHEMAHQRGFTRENEANFIAYVVCMNSAEPELRYSAAMSALIYLLRSIHRNVPEEYEGLAASP